MPGSLQIEDVSKEFWKVSAFNYSFVVLRFQFDDCSGTVNLSPMFLHNLLVHQVCAFYVFPNTVLNLSDYVLYFLYLLRILLHFDSVYIFMDITKQIVKDGMAPYLDVCCKTHYLLDFWEMMRYWEHMD